MGSVKTKFFQRGHEVAGREAEKRCRVSPWTGTIVLLGLSSRGGGPGRPGNNQWRLCLSPLP
eukprot:9894845-Prorocentrum_lima.AAC.1